jgi:micrococcal nuclease
MIMYRDFAFRVKEVLDGDTIVGDAFRLDTYNVFGFDIETEHLDASPVDIPIRIKNIDAPEITQPFGIESKTYLESLILNKVIYCRMIDKQTFTTKLGLIKLEYEEGRDKYGRYLAEIYLKSLDFQFTTFDINNLEESILEMHEFYTTGYDGVPLDELMVLGGYAWHYEKYSEKPELEDLQIQAQNNSSGLWACNPLSRIEPWLYRKKKREIPSFTLPPCT